MCFLMISVFVRQSVNCFKFCRNFFKIAWITIFSAKKSITSDYSERTSMWELSLKILHKLDKNCGFHCIFSQLSNKKNPVILLLYYIKKSVQKRSIISIFNAPKAFIMAQKGKKVVRVWVHECMVRIDYSSWGPPLFYRISERKGVSVLRPSCLI